jgi:hypothetical protein
MSSGAQAVEDALKEIEAKVREFTGAVDSALGWVPDFLAGLLGDVLRKWDEFCAKMNEFFALVNEIFSYGWGDAEALRASATAWRESVADLLDSAYELLSDDAIKADTSWRGGAGDIYAANFQNQIDAIRDSKDASIVIADLLDDHADALDTFYSNLTGGLIGAGASLAGLVVSCIALVPPITPIGIIGLIVSAIGLAVSLYFLFTNEWNDLQRMSELGVAGLQTAREDAATEWPRFVNV